jgi:hypothetical protein
MPCTIVVPCCWFSASFDRFRFTLDHPLKRVPEVVRGALTKSALGHSHRLLGPRFPSSECIAAFHYLRSDGQLIQCHEMGPPRGDLLIL